MIKIHLQQTQDPCLKVVKIEAYQNASQPISYLELELLLSLGCLFLSTGSPRRLNCYLTSCNIGALKPGYNRTAGVINHVIYKSDIILEILQNFCLAYLQTELELENTTAVAGLNES